MLCAAVTLEGLKVDTLRMSLLENLSLLWKFPYISHTHTHTHACNIICTPDCSGRHYIEVIYNIIAQIYDIIIWTQSNTIHTYIQLFYSQKTQGKLNPSR